MSDVDVRKAIGEPTTSRSYMTGKQFIPLRDDAICEYMKTITVPKLYRALRDLVYPVVVPEPTATRAHTLAETVIALTLEILGLERTFHDVSIRLDIIMSTS